MIIISYDITDDKLRTRFSKYLSRYGHRIQYSVYEIDNSERILNNIMCEIENKFMKSFTQADSVYVFRMSKWCDIKRFGYAKNEESTMIII